MPVYQSDTSVVLVVFIKNSSFFLFYSMYSFFLIYLIDTFSYVLTYYLTTKSLFLKLSHMFFLFIQQFRYL